MTSRNKKPSAIAKAIEDSVFSSVNQEYVSDDDNGGDTIAKVVDKDDEEDDIFNMDFSAASSSYTSKPSRLRVLNAASGIETDKRYQGKKVSRKQLNNLEDDEALENDSDDSEDELMNAKEHQLAELGHMFEMEGVEYEDDDFEDLSKKKKKYKDFQRYDNIDIAVQSESDEEEEDDSDIEKNHENETALSPNSADKDDDDDEVSSNEVSDEENDHGQNDLSDDDSNDLENIEDDMEMGPDLSQVFSNAAQDDVNESEDEVEDDEASAPATIVSQDIDQEVAKGQAIKRQLQIWDGLLELRITMQKSLTKINQLPQAEDWESYKRSEEEKNLSHVKKVNFNLAKVLDQLLQLRGYMIDKNPVIVEDDDDVGEKPPPEKKMKLGEYKTCLQKNFTSMKNWRNSTIENWNDRTRIATTNSNAKGFSGFDTSVTRQIEHIVSDKPRLVKRTQLKRTAYDILGLENDENECNAEIFDDDDFYHQLLRELIERKTSGITDPIILGQQWLQLQKVRAKAKKKVDTRASKGRKTRYDIHAKLVNFMAPTYPVSSLTEEAKNELFSSLFTNPSQ